MGYFEIILQQYGFDDQDSSSIVEAFKGVGIDENISEASSAHEALEWLNIQLQTKFIRPPGSERQHLIDMVQNLILSSDILFSLSAFTKEIMTGANDSIKILFGASEKGIRTRLNTLLKITQEGHNTTTVYPLGGERDLWPIQEEITATLVAERIAALSGGTLEAAIDEVNKDFAGIFAEAIKMQESIRNSNDKSAEEKLNEQHAFVTETNKARAQAIAMYTNKGVSWPTETDMMNKVISEYQFQHIELRSIEFKPTISAPKNAQGDRPNTLDTLVKMWGDYGGAIIDQAARQPYGYLPMTIITGQPEAHYQRLQAVSAFYDKPIKVDTVAQKATIVNLSVVFDNIARMVYAGKTHVTEMLARQENSICAAGLAL